MTDQILSNVADAIIDSSVPITITIQPRSNVYRWLQQFHILPKQKVYQMRPICLGALIKISKLIMSITKDKDAEKDFTVHMYTMVVDHTETMIRIIAIALMNSKADPPEKLLELIEREFTAKDLSNAISVIHEKMNTKSFLISIISVRGLNVLVTKKEMSPKVQGSQIASGEQSEV